MFNKAIPLFAIFIFLSCNSKKEGTIEYPEFEIGVVADCQYCYCDARAIRFYKKAP